jgi:hypothetical protein
MTTAIDEGRETEPLHRERHKGFLVLHHQNLSGCFHQSNSGQTLHTAEEILSLKFPASAISEDELYTAADTHLGIAAGKVKIVTSWVKSSITSSPSQP